MYVMVDIITMGLLELWGVQTDNYKMKNSCPKYPVPSSYEANALTIALVD